MNDTTAQILCNINNDFYRVNAGSFSATRNQAWAGQQRCLDLLDAELRTHTELKVLDIACGNLRFEKWLSEQLPDTQLEFYATDNCKELVNAASATGGTDSAKANVDFRELNILHILLEHQRLSAHLGAPKVDLSVCFGFMHHVPGVHYRAALLRELVATTRSGGYVICTFWQFALRGDSLDKAVTSTNAALMELGPERYELDLDAGDFLLGWKNIERQYRYCHSFTDAEIDGLLDEVADIAHVVTRFVSDGKTGKENCYVILQTR